MPIRGHSGVQGGAEMGAYATALPGRHADQRENARGALARSTASRCPTRPGSPRRRWSRPRRAASSTCSIRSAATSCAPCPIPTTSRDALAARAAARPPGHHPHRSDADRAGQDDGQVLLLPAKTRYEQDGGGTADQHRAARDVQPRDPARRSARRGPSGGSCASWRRRSIRERAAPASAARAARPSAPRSRASSRSTTASSSLQRSRRVVPVRRPAPLRRRTLPHRRRQGALPPGAAAGARPARPACSRSARRRGKQFNTLIYAEIDPLTGAAARRDPDQPRRRRRAAPQRRRSRRAGQRRTAASRAASTSRPSPAATCRCTGRRRTR